MIHFFNGVRILCILFLMFCRLVRLPCKNYQCPRNMENSVQFLASIPPCNQEPYTPMQNGTIALWASTVRGRRAEETDLTLTWPRPWPHMLWRTDLENGARRLLTHGRSDTGVFGVTWCYVCDATGAWPGMFLKLKLVNLFFWRRFALMRELVRDRRDSVISGRDMWLWKKYTG